MSAGTISFRAGRRERQDDYRDFSGPDGMYDMTLVSVSAPYEAPSTFHRSGRQTFRDWVFAVSDGGPHDGEVLDIRSTVSTSDKSKQYEIVTALIGRNPELDTDIDIDRRLVGRGVQAHVATNDSGWPYVKTLVPAKGGAAQADAPRAARAARAPAPAADPDPAAPAADDSDLPF